MDYKPKISEKYALDYYRQSLPTRAWKYLWNWLAIPLAVLAVVVMYCIGGKSMFQAAPVASVHSTFGRDCGKCHSEEWGTGRRLVEASNSPHSVSNKACQACHQTASHTFIGITEPTCAECHQEHRPGKRLTALADNACVQCHSGLEAELKKQGNTNPVSFVNAISQFEEGDGGHPEFAILDKRKVGGWHSAKLVAQFKESGANGGKWIDRGGLNFKHSTHLDKAIVRDPKNRKGELLTCANCHVVAADGYMRPVNYEQHCNRCHLLSVVTMSGETIDLPHSTVEEVRGVIRLRIAKLLERSPAKKAGATADDSLPRLPRAASLSPEKERDLAAQATQVEQAIFGPGSKAACNRCHRFDTSDGNWRVVRQQSVEIAGPKTLALESTAEMVPSRWMRHANFSHVSHQAVACTECHNAGCSEHTSDILMPSIDVCRSCHGEGARTASSRVSADCVLCHTYHSGAPAKTISSQSLDNLFSDGSSQKADSVKQ